ncbi:NADH ubiquinone oxidoreductase subunit 10 [Schistosoma japonicum]|uniref:XK-related protein n=1 Tax=Schistosoma japonicum TaxID=6182 RepID=A0A4Z2CVR3_SCHJA|nr:NADH ubiquinone oxidoreductase subunit 10 [Schistosoma japonicum]TNN08080.1 NADH ubiquinone oxidoreductase subunit 10 [Schistosoma japonicum]
MSSYQSYSGVAYTNLSSVASVSVDLIAHRGVWRKIISIILFMGFLITSWSVIVLHAIHFTNESILELSVSISVLIGGQYIITGIVDGIIYWKRWNASSQRRRTKIQEQNKEAWVLMRITLTLLGMAPVARYIESLVAVKRMISLEKQYMSETIALVKEVQQPSNLPSGSLLSVPITNTQLSQQRKTPDITSNPERMRQLDDGLQRIRRVRRQFCRTENDAASIALTSGVVGAGPFAIAQGILFYRRETMHFLMTIDTKIILLICTIFCMLWISTCFTHYYPVQYQQNELEFERGIKQVHLIGLFLLFIVHLIHITLRCLSIALFTGRFYPMIFIILIGHFLIILIILIIARQYTTQLNHINHIGISRGDVCGNFFADLIHSYISLYEFFNAGVKYTRTRYLIYYFFYYLENSIMIGLWYDYYEYPESWYYLPCLLVVILVQLLGFILLQIYLYVYSKSRRKTTLCGFCFAHKTTEMQPESQARKQQDQKYSESLFNYNRNSSQRTDLMNAPQSLHRQQQTSTLNNYSSMNSLSYAATLPKRVHNGGGICDPVFGEQIAQTAAPLKSRNNMNNIYKRKANLQQSIENNSGLNQRPNSELTTSYYSRPTGKQRRYQSEERHKAQSGSHADDLNSRHIKQRTESSSRRPVSHISQSTNNNDNHQRILRSNGYLLQQVPSTLILNSVHNSSNIVQSKKNMNSKDSERSSVYQPRTAHTNHYAARSRARERQQ